MSEQILKVGDKVIYSYRHTLNSKSSFINSKNGVIVREKKRKKKFLSDWYIDKIWAVKVDGNKGLSFIKETQLIKDEKK